MASFIIIFFNLQVLKLYAWEPSFEAQVNNVRTKEVKVLKQIAFLNAGTSFIWGCTPFMVSGLNKLNRIFKSGNPEVTGNTVLYPTGHDQITVVEAGQSYFNSSCLLLIFLFFF